MSTPKLNTPYWNRLLANGHLIDFTPEEMAKMKISLRHHSGFYREKANPFFAAHRVSEDKYVYYLISGRMMINGAKLNGIQLNRYTILDGTLDEAREEAIKRHAKYSAMAVRKKRHVQMFYPVGGGDAIRVVDHLMTPGGKSDPNYEPLMSVLLDAYAQASSGKGAERHANGKDFIKQDLVSITQLTGIGGPIYQAIKKLVEGRALPNDKARKEFLGAIVYIAGAVVAMDKTGSS